MTLPFDVPELPAAEQTTETIEYTYPSDQPILTTYA